MILEQYLFAQVADCIKIIIRRDSGEKGTLNDKTINAVFPLT